MSLINVVLVLVAGLNLGMALLIWMRNPKNKINIYFALSVLMIGLWSFGEAMLRQASTDFLALFWARTENLFGFLIAAFFVFFTIYYPYENLKPSLIFKSLVFLVAAIGVFIITTPIYINEVIVSPPATDFIGLFWGRLIFTLTFFIILLSGFAILVKKYFSAKGIIKKNLLSILVATGIFGTLGGYFGVVLPFFTGRDNPWFAPLFSVPMVIVLVWFIFRKE